MAYSQARITLCLHLGLPDGGHLLETCDTMLTGSKGTFHVGRTRGNNRDDLPDPETTGSANQKHILQGPFLSKLGCYRFQFNLSLVTGLVVDTGRRKFSAGVLLDDRVMKDDRAG